MKAVVFLFFLIGSALVLFAQVDSVQIGNEDSVQIDDEDSVQIGDEDSLLNSRLIETSKMLRKSDSLRKVDSIYKLQLLKSIEDLQSSEYRKRDELIQQVRELEIADSIREAEQRQRLLTLKKETKGFPIAPFGDTLFFIYSKIGPLTPSERAKNIEEKLEKLEDDNFFHRDSLYIFPNEASHDLMYNDVIVMSITDLDALWIDTKRNVLANQYLKIIRESIEMEREQNSLKNNLIRAGLVLLILLGAFLLIKGVNIAFKFLDKRLAPLKRRYFKGVKVKNYVLLDRKREYKVFEFVFYWIRILTIVLIIYFTLPVLFSVFPWTKGFSDYLLHLILDPFAGIFNSIIAYVPNLIKIAVIFIFVRYTIRFFYFIAKEIELGKLKITGFYADWAKPTFHIVKILLYAFMFVVIFPYLPGSDSEIFKGVSVFLGILFSLGSSSAIANAVAGYVITYMRPFHIGDRVKIGDITGDVVEKTILVTRIRTAKNEEITVPNSSVLSGFTTNYSSAANNDQGLILYTSVTIGYDVPWRKVHELLEEAALQTKGILKKPKPFVLQTSLDDFYVSYQINGYTKQPNQMTMIYSELHKNIQDRFNDAGVEIMSPHYESQRDGSHTTVPSQT